MLFFSENIVNSPLLWHVSVWRWKKINRVDLLCFFKVDSAVLGQRNVDERARDRIAAITAIATKYQKDLAAVYSPSGTNERMCLQSCIYILKHKAYACRWMQVREHDKSEFSSAFEVHTYIAKNPWVNTLTVLNVKASDEWSSSRFSLKL